MNGGLVGMPVEYECECDAMYSSAEQRDKCRDRQHYVRELRAPASEIERDAARTLQLIGQEAADEMLKRDGFYICGDANHPGAIVPIHVLDGKAYAWEQEYTPLRPDGWQPTLLVSGPFLAPRIAPLQREE